VLRREDLARVLDGGLSVFTDPRHRAHGEGFVGRPDCVYLAGQDQLPFLWDFYELDADSGVEIEVNVTEGVRPEQILPDEDVYNPALLGQPVPAGIACGPGRYSRVELWAEAEGLGIPGVDGPTSVLDSISWGRIAVRGGISPLAIRRASPERRRSR
jgi:hypothetical protein